MWWFQQQIFLTSDFKCQLLQSDVHNQYRLSVISVSFCEIWGFTVEAENYWSYQCLKKCMFDGICAWLTCLSNSLKHLAAAHSLYRKFTVLHVIAKIMSQLDLTIKQYKQTNLGFVLWIRGERLSNVLDVAFLSAFSFSQAWTCWVWPEIFWWTTLLHNLYL